MELPSYPDDPPCSIDTEGICFTESSKSKISSRLYSTVDGTGKLTRTLSLQSNPGSRLRKHPYHAEIRHHKLDNETLRVELSKKPITWGDVALYAGAAVLAVGTLGTLTGWGGYAYRSSLIDSPPEQEQLHTRNTRAISEPDSTLSNSIIPPNYLYMTKKNGTMYSHQSTDDNFPQCNDVIDPGYTLENGGTLALDTLGLTPGEGKMSPQNWIVKYTDCDTPGGGHKDTNPATEGSTGARGSSDTRVPQSFVA